MKDIEEYFKPVKKDGKQVGIALDYTELSGDRAFELYPNNKKERAAFQQGFLESLELNTALNKKNENFTKPEGKIVGLDGKAL